MKYAIVKSTRNINLKDRHRIKEGITIQHEHEVIAFFHSKEEALDNLAHFKSEVHDLTGTWVKKNLKTFYPVTEYYIKKSWFHIQKPWLYINIFVGDPVEFAKWDKRMDLAKIVN